MVIRFISDNMNYGVVGQEIEMSDSTVRHIGDICKIKLGNGEIVDCMVVLPEWNKQPIYMGIGDINIHEKILSIIPYTNLKIGDKHRDCLIVSDC